MQKVILLSTITGTQIMSTLGLLLLDTTTAAAAVTPSPITFTSLVAVITLLSSLGVFALLFKIGVFVGTAGQRITALEVDKTANALESKAISATLAHHGETLAVMTNDVQNIKKDLRVVRERQHDLANVMTQATLVPVRLKPIGEGDNA
jgi:hypothetical protein